jgi:hypothetical protein
MLYRVTRDIDMGKEILKAGRLIPGSRFKALGRLVERGALRPVASPPLAILPSWEKRALRLECVGIVNIVDALEAEPQTIARALRVPLATVAEYLLELETWLRVAPLPSN